MRHLTIALALLALGGAPACAQALPGDLAELVERAGLGGSVDSWCEAVFADGPGGYTVMASSDGSGRYVALRADGSAAELAAYQGTGELACHSRADAEALSAAIAESGTVLGGITPRWDTTVVCGFVDATTARCWQDSPEDGAFVEVGGWVT